MSSFTTLLVVSPLPNGRNWELNKSFIYHIGTKFSRHYIKVPKGFVTDFASTDVLQQLAILMTVPYIVLLQKLPLWVGYSYAVIILLAILITPYGRHSKAAVLHDYLYQNHQVSRRMSDLIFYEAMKVGGTSKSKARLMYYGVRLFGFRAWRGGNKKCHN